MLPIDVARLDDFFRSNSIPAPSVIKIDTEGSEFFAIQGMGYLLKGQSPPIISFEYIEEDAGRYGVTLPRIIAYIQDESKGGYEFFRPDTDGSLINKDSYRETVENDIVAVPSWRANEIKAICKN